MRSRRTNALPFCICGRLLIGLCRSGLASHIPGKHRCQHWTIPKGFRQGMLLALGLSFSGMAAAPELLPAPRVRFPHETDSNSPGHWGGDRFYLFNSAGHPYRSSGSNVFALSGTSSVRFNNQVNGGRWMEATWPASNGILYGWYHNEPGGLCPGTNLTAPQIGAALSSDKGAAWTDLGIVLRAPPNTLKCDARNGYFAGGHGDFCVMLDPPGQFLYFFFSTYAGDVTEQGVAVARMSWADRDAPQGKVFKWNNGSWRSPGLGGSVTPFLQAATAWERADCDAFWGPSVHWNSALRQYVMLLNRAKGTGWTQEGIYISFCTNLAQPSVWSVPRKILQGGAWYPQVIGLAPGIGTDKSAGGRARFFMAGVSDYEIDFEAASGPSRHPLMVTSTGDTMVFSWPASLTNFVLESASTLGTTNWSRMTNPRASCNGELTFTINISGLGQSRFFRLWPR